MTTILIGMEKKLSLFHEIDGVDNYSLHIKKMGTWLSKLIHHKPTFSSNIYIFPAFFDSPPLSSLLSKAPGKRLRIVPNENGIRLVRSQADILPDEAGGRFLVVAKTGGFFQGIFVGGWVGRIFRGSLYLKKNKTPPEKKLAS